MTKLYKNPIFEFLAEFWVKFWSDGKKWSQKSKLVLISKLPIYGVNFKLDFRIQWSNLVWHVSRIQKSHPIWRRQKVEVDSTPSAPWHFEKIFLSLAVAVANIKEHYHKVYLPIDASLYCKHFSPLPVQNGRFVGKVLQTLQLWNEGLQWHSHMIFTTASCNKQLFIWYLNKYE